MVVYRCAGSGGFACSLRIEGDCVVVVVVVGERRKSAAAGHKGGRLDPV